MNRWLSKGIQDGRPFWKVCCIQSEAEAALAVQRGARALGLVSAMPSGPGVIDEATIAAIVPTVPADVLPVLLTSETDAEVIAGQLRRTGARAVQLCDELAREAHRALRRALPEVVVIQVVHVTGEESVAQAVDVGSRPEVDALLLDSGNPRAAVRELGGTGRVHDWGTSRRIVGAVPVPVFLAGGLRADNLRGALDAVAPFGIDVCSGVRTSGALDASKLAAFAEALGLPAGARGTAR